MANLSPITLIKVFVFFLTLLVFFLPVWSMHNLLLSCVICFDFVLNVLIVVYTPRVYLSEVKVNIVKVIESN